MDPAAESPMLWAAGAGVVGLTLVYVWLLADPMLVYLLLVTALMAAFPTYRPVMAFGSLFGVLRIAIRHDPVTGDMFSFVSAVAEGVDITVGTTVGGITFLALFPFFAAVPTFDPGAIKEAFLPALPLVSLLGLKTFVEMQTDEDVTQLLMAGAEHLQQLFRSLRTFLVLLR